MSISLMVLDPNYENRGLQTYFDGLGNCHVDLCDCVGELVQVTNHVINLRASAVRLM